MKVLFKKVLRFTCYVFVPIALGGIVALLTGFKGYKSFKKPSLSPPGVVFPIVWSILYLLMGIGHYMVQKDEFHDDVFKIFCYQLGVNLLWSFLFFKFKLFTVSALWIALLIYLVIKMTLYFYHNKKLAGIMQVPYIIWLLIALYLNIGVAILN